MHKRDYFLAALRAGAAKKRHWVNSMFAVVESNDREVDYPFRYWLEEGKRVFINPTTNEKDVIESTRRVTEPLCDFRELFPLQAYDLPNYTGEDTLQTTYGNVLVNYLLLVIPFGDLLPFQAGHFSVKDVEKEVHKRLIDDPEDDDGVSYAPDGNIYVRQYLQFSDYALSLVAYASISVVSVTPKAMQSHPQARKRRKELIEEYKGRLNDPAIIAKIGDELEALDREWLKDDPADEFYKAKGKKGYGKVRNKLFYMFGGESSFSDGSTMELVERSLEEGIDPDKLPAMINSLRAGSYNRGAQTQLGGESTKTIYRMLGTIRTAEEDCETTLGIPTTVTEYNSKSLIGFWVIDRKKSVLIDAENHTQYVGKEIMLRTPMTCKTEGRNVCARCVGQDLSEQPDGLPAAAAGLGGRFLSLFLAKMHGSALKTQKWDKTARLS